MPKRFDFKNKKDARFKTKDGGFVTLHWYTWQRHIISEKKRQHLDLNRKAIIQTLLNYDVKTISKSNPKIVIFQKEIKKFYFFNNFTAPRVIFIVVHMEQKKIKTIYDHVTFKK